MTFERSARRSALCFRNGRKREQDDRLRSEPKRRRWNFLQLRLACETQLRKALSRQSRRPGAICSAIKRHVSNSFSA